MLLDLGAGVKNAERSAGVKAPGTFRSHIVEKAAPDAGSASPHRPGESRQQPKTIRHSVCIYDLGGSLLICRSLADSHLTEHFIGQKALDLDIGRGAE